MLASWLCAGLILAKASLLDVAVHVGVGSVRLDRLLLYWVGIGEWIADARIYVGGRLLGLVEWIEARWLLLGGAVRDLLRLVDLHVHRVRIILEREIANVRGIPREANDRLTNEVSVTPLAATGSQAFCSSIVGSAHDCRSPEAKIP